MTDLGRCRHRCGRRPDKPACAWRLPPLAPAIRQLGNVRSANTEGNGSTSFLAPSGKGLSGTAVRSTPSHNSTGTYKIHSR